MRFFSLLFLFFSRETLHGQCLVPSLVISTAYNPVLGVAIGGGYNGAMPITDPHWKVAAISPGVTSAISSTTISGLVEVAPGNHADIILPVAGYWATNPAAFPGGWISCLNSNTYTTDGGGISGTAYNMILSRTFRMCYDDHIKLSFHVANDNYISGTNVDGTPLSFSQTVDTLFSNFARFTPFSQEIFLTAGVHTLNIIVDNYNTPDVRNNPTGMNLYGTVSSATGASPFVSESTAECDSYMCDAIILTGSCDSCDIWFPSAFTPNGDGKNDIIRVVGNLKFYKNFSLAIYNRFGQRVFYTDDIYTGWNGKFLGVDQDLGTFFYMIHYTLNDKKYLLKGDLQLIR